MISGIILRKNLEWIYWVAYGLIEIDNAVEDMAGANSMIDLFAQRFPRPANTSCSLNMGSASLQKLEGCAHGPVWQAERVPTPTAAPSPHAEDGQVHSALYR